MMNRRQRCTLAVAGRMQEELYVNGKQLAHFDPRNVALFYEAEVLRSVTELVVEGYYEVTAIEFTRRADD